MDGTTGVKITRKQIVEAARSMIGTPWVHQGRSESAGVDCLGLVIVLGYKLGYLEDFDYFVYHRQPDGITLLRELRKKLDEIKPEDIGLGDIVVIKFPGERLPQHVGIVVNGERERMIIHALKTKNTSEVVEEPLARWIPRITHAFKLRNIIE